LYSIVRPTVVVADEEVKCFKGIVEQIAGMVAGEGSARSVGAAQSGCQPDDQKFPLPIAE